MYFLIDYENVTNSGMRGTKYLLPTDILILFYSKNVPNMEARYLEDIQNSECKFEVSKLLNAKKNGLDFYIATKTGEIFGANDRKATVVIVSKDAGFQAVRDYWQSCAKPSRRVILAESIERGILKACPAEERLNVIRDRLRNLDIGQFYAAYKETMQLRQLLQEAFTDTEYLDRTPEIEQIVKNGKTAKVIYLNTLHCFGRKDGLAVYQRLKNLSAAKDQ